MHAHSQYTQRCTHARAHAQAGSGMFPYSCCGANNPMIHKLFFPFFSSSFVFSLSSPGLYLLLLPPSAFPRSPRPRTRTRTHAITTHTHTDTYIHTHTHTFFNRSVLPSSASQGFPTCRVRALIDWNHVFLVYLKRRIVTTADCVVIKHPKGK